MMVDHGTFLVSTTYLTEAMAIDRIAPELRKKAEDVFRAPRRCCPRRLPPEYASHAAVMHRRSRTARTPKKSSRWWTVE